MSKELTFNQLLGGSLNRSNRQAVLDQQRKTSAINNLKDKILPVLFKKSKIDIHVNPKRLIK
jgi:hypothetical protein